MDLEENENTEKEMRNQIINYAEENQQAFYEKKLGNSGAKPGKPTYLPMMMHLETETKSSTSYDASAKDGKDAKDAKGRKDKGKNPTPENPTAADSATGVSILHS
ncbi:hypothetical protein IMY05_013G0125100 [Salix suchowensis]|nr:hypothetical protein IMY05_013G0125100 [Salix suchowensis]